MSKLKNKIKEIGKAARELEEDFSQIICGELYEEEGLLEMANLAPQETGLSRFVWAGIRNNQHADRIKVTNNPRRMDWDDAFIISVEDNPRLVGGICEMDTKDLNKVFEFVKLNKDLLLKYSRHTMTTQDFLNQLKKV